MGYLTPETFLSIEAQYFYDLFFDINDGLNRRAENIFLKMTWKDIKDYTETMQIELGPDEISMLMSMDVVFTDAMNREIAAYIKRASDK